MSTAIGGGVGDDDNNNGDQLDAICRLPVRDGYFILFFISTNQSRVSNIFISFNKRQFISATIDCGTIFSLSPAFLFVLAYFSRKLKKKNVLAMCGLIESIHSEEKKTMIDRVISALFRINFIARFHSKNDCYFFFVLSRLFNIFPLRRAEVQQINYSIHDDISLHTLFICSV